MNNSSFERFQPIAFLSTNTQEIPIIRSLSQNLPVTIWLPNSTKSLENQELARDNLKYYNDSLSEHLTNIWRKYRAFVFCLATGAVIRLIAPLLKGKDCDPAVIVIDRAGKFVISLCSGHQGGADLLAKLIAHQIDATPVITGASSSLQLPAIDILGYPYGWVKGSGNWTGVMAALARQEQVQVIQETGNTLWQHKHLENKIFDFDSATTTIPQARIWISEQKRNFTQSQLPQVQWHPRVLWIGIGCERGTSTVVIEQAVIATCEKYNLAHDAIAGIATIDIKADEVGILELCNCWNVPLKTFTSEKLKQVTVPTPSEIVRQEVGTSSVAEAAAICAVEKDVNSLIVPKQVFKEKGKPGGVTVAVAKANREYTGRTGKLYLVGIGPGSLAQITPAAKVAITEADVVIGYSLYLDLIQPLLRPEQIIESFPITQEKQRGERAISLAELGLTVAVVSSGDCGIYGMAGLVLEQLKVQHWDGNTPKVEVFPGISALQAAASRVGAPLMHDFCAISLSDLLTPWEVIKKRLEAAAMADFVTVLYNPRSQKRTQQIITAQEIFLKHRDNNTPVAIVRSVYREEEQITITTLEKMLDNAIDMLTTVIIGNSNTCNYQDWMITPRGYLENIF
ncbi:MAG: precorrin-3B C(17)-methyltransferase [Xenococcaceae cyanobacterium MO_207.B15]|nr:precorrin-3B C(17)-methyltransferase [Xenococcaceae cyanobacterium MO_207.B15]